MITKKELYEDTTFDDLEEILFSDEGIDSDIIDSIPDSIFHKIQKMTKEDGEYE